VRPSRPAGEPRRGGLAPHFRRALRSPQRDRDRSRPLGRRAGWSDNGRVASASRARTSGERALLSQSHGFKGVGIVPISPHPHDPPAAHCPHALVYDQTTPPTPSARPDEGNHLVTGLHRSSTLKSTRSNGSNQVAHASRTPSNPRRVPQSQSRNVLPLDVGVVHPAERLPITPPLRFDHCKDDVRVLVRHRPSSIARSVGLASTVLARAAREGMVGRQICALASAHASSDRQDCNVVAQRISGTARSRSGIPLTGP
jgi:hypothetical protein